MACIFGWKHEPHIIGRREGRIQVNEWCLLVTFMRKIHSFKRFCEIDVPQFIDFLCCLQSVSTSRWEIHVGNGSFAFHMICSNVGCFKIKMFHECFVFLATFIHWCVLLTFPFFVNLLFDDHHIKMAVESKSYINFCMKTESLNSIR